MLLETLAIKPDQVRIPPFSRAAVLASAFTEISCRELIQVGLRRGFEQAGVRTDGGTQHIRGIRNNSRAAFANGPLASLVLNHVWPPTASAFPSTQVLRANPYVRLYRYEPGQRFKPHRDGSHEIGPHRTDITCLVYLNSDFVGGETEFFPSGPRQARTDNSKWVLHPASGTAVVFHHSIWHAGAPVAEGTKYVLRVDFLV